MQVLSCWKWNRRAPGDTMAIIRFKLNWLVTGVSRNTAAVLLGPVGGSTDDVIIHVSICRRGLCVLCIHICCDCTLRLPNCAALFFSQATILYIKKTQTEKKQADNQISELPPDHCNNWKVTFIEMRKKNCGGLMDQAGGVSVPSLLCGLKARRQQTNSAYLIW